MKKTISAMSILGLAAVLGFAFAMNLHAANQGKKEISLYGGKSGNVLLNHHLHQDAVGDCQVCHKDFEQKEGALDAAKKSGALKAKQVMNKTCIQCHRDKKKAGEKAGPVSCNDCHKK